MTITLQGVNDYSGFLLSEEAEIDADLAVLTGLNGSGKTRLLNSIRTGGTKVKVDGEVLERSEIKTIQDNQFTPRVMYAYDDSNYENKISELISFYKSRRNQIEGFLKEPNNRSRGGSDIIRNVECLKLIAQKSGKKVLELSASDISLHYSEPTNDIIGFQNIALTFNAYLRAREKNEFYEWKSKIKGKKLSYVDADSFEKVFGPEPWKLMNEILLDIFDEKFMLTEPEDGDDRISTVRLIERDTGNAIQHEMMSSGEKTLLWLSVTLFNCFYYASDEERKKVKLILLDEPDSKLHPKMVVKMYGVLNEFSKAFGAKLIITTHSPTTVSLARDSSISLVANQRIQRVDKDHAVSSLLDGVNQISVRPENNKWVYVESRYDANIYQKIFSCIRGKSNVIDPSISLTFVPAGPKMAKQQLRSSVKAILDIDDEDVIESFVEAVNGAGNCSGVYGSVESLEGDGSAFVKGVVDWDLGNSPTGNVVVLGHGYAYSIENIVFDPICVPIVLHISSPDKYPMVDLCGENVTFHEWIDRHDLMQKTADYFLGKVLGRESKRNERISYFGGAKVDTDREYLLMQGHDLAGRVVSMFPELKRECGSALSMLGYHIVNKAMITYSGCKLVPGAFERVFGELQSNR